MIPEPARRRKRILSLRRPGGTDGRRTDFSVTETSDGDCVTNSVSVSDFLGRTARVVTPLSDSAYAYAGASPRVLSGADSVSGLSTATLYDDLREPVGSVSAGVSSLSSTRYELSSGAWWRVTETRETAGAQTNLLSTARERRTGLSDALRSETFATDADGVTTHAVSSFDPATKVLTETTASPVASTVVRRSMFGHEIERTEEGEIVQTFYDPFGRACASARLGVEGTVPYKRFGTILGRDENGDVCWRYEPVAADDGVPILSSYDSLGNLVSEETYVEGSYGEDYTTRTVTHDLSGRVTEESGDTVYPTKQSYDALGRRVSLSTTRNGTAWDVTRWGYDPATGLCTNKTYADGSLVSHTFTADGLPLRTTFASGRWTQNSYDANRRLSSVSTSDGEGAVSYLYDAFGRVTRATGGAARYDYARDALGRVTSEVRRTGGIRPTVVSSLSRPYDAFGRPAGYGLSFYGDFRQGVCYTWGMDGKLAGMVCSNAQGRAVEVSFDWDRGRGVGWSVEGLGDCYAYFTQVFERDAWRPWLVPYAAAGKPGPRGTMPDYSVSYAFDRLGRPVSRSGDAFAYNPRGEVTNATISSAAYRYAYDGIGNRETAYEAGTTTAYSANNVNQYTEVGSAQPSYDADGNLVDDGTRTFAWSASGHLTDAATSSRRLWADYDHLGRRTFRATDRRSGFHWSISDEREFVYDGWNLIHEHRYDYQDDSDTDIEYFWGPDLSGTLQGAGGVGGLVAVSIDGDFYFPGYDNNGNVIGYWNEDGELVAEYAYDAFGNTTYEDGDMADVFPHRFSTKYYDAETDLYYYGYRYYSPSLGRWISRDPIGEEGGNNLFLFVNNDPCSWFDLYGELSQDQKDAVLFALTVAVKLESLYDFVKNGELYRYSESQLNKYKTAVDRLRQLPFADSVIKSAILNRVQEQIKKDNPTADNPLFKKMLHLYLYGKGDPLVLTASELSGVLQRQSEEGKPLDVQWADYNKKERNSDFVTIVKTGGSRRYAGQTYWYVQDGTLGNYTLKFDGILTVRNGCPEKWSGTVWLDASNHEYYDFNPDWKHDPNLENGLGNLRTHAAESNVRRMYIAGVGTPYLVSSQKTRFVIDYAKQRSKSKSWFGGF